ATGRRPRDPSAARAPSPSRPPTRPCGGACACPCLDAGFELVDQQSVGSLAAVIAEPVLSTGGIIVPPDGYLARLQEHCARRGMLLVLDEAHTCLRPPGAIVAFERDGVVPPLPSPPETLGGRAPPRAPGTPPPPTP